MNGTASYDIKIRQGNTLHRIFRFKDSGGLPYDLTGAEIVFRVPSTQAGVLRKTTADGSLAMSDPSLGEISFTLSPGETRTLWPGRICPYDLELRNASGETTLLAGFLTVTEGANDDS